MKNKPLIVILVLLLIFVILAIGYFVFLISRIDNDGATNSNSTSKIDNQNSTQIANPAAVKCEADGGESLPIMTDAGVDAYCVFPDGSLCLQWDYFRGDCDRGKCFKECQNIGTKNEGWYNGCNGDLIDFAVCGETNTDLKDIKEETTNLNIKLFQPTANEQLSSPFTVAGQARVFENQINIRVKSKDGRVLIEESALALSPDIGQWGEFSLDVEYDFNLTTEGFLEVYSVSAKDGSEENLISIPVKF